ncbi:MAG: hypothetical protein KGH72_01605 [Candidatus Micrarchaeota archaeon]|nr:hypothetical protein [Candidatus Micrarchaeota archaeon]
MIRHNARQAAASNGHHSLPNGHADPERLSRPSNGSVHISNDDYATRHGRIIDVVRDQLRDAFGKGILVVVSGSNGTNGGANSKSALSDIDVIAVTKGGKQVLDISKVATMSEALKGAFRQLSDEGIHAIVSPVFTSEVVLEESAMYHIAAASQGVSEGSVNVTRLDLSMFTGRKALKGWAMLDLEGSRYFIERLMDSSTLLGSQGRVDKSIAALWRAERPKTGSPSIIVATAEVMIAETYMLLNGNIHLSDRLLSKEGLVKIKVIANLLVNAANLSRNGHFSSSLGNGSTNGVVPKDAMPFVESIQRLRASRDQLPSVDDLLEIYMHAAEVVHYTRAAVTK